MGWLINMIRGFCMALADSVPGVSGGTIAFVMGFYDKFINSLNDIVFGKKEQKKEAIIFLSKLLVGWALGMIAAVLVLTSFFETNIYEVSSLFIGFIALSIYFVIKEEKSALKGKTNNLIFTLIGAILVCLLTYFNPMSGGNLVDISSFNIGLAAYTFVAAMLAISAMVLPGISGSTILLIFGLYIPIISAIKEVLHFDFSYLPILIIFGFGILTGLAVVIKGIKAALEKYRSQTMYTIIGLMVGSFYAIVMGPKTLEVPKAPMNIDNFSILFFIIGGALIFGLQKLRDVLEKKQK